MKIWDETCCEQLWGQCELITWCSSIVCHHWSFCDCLKINTSRNYYVKLIKLSRNVFYKQSISVLLNWTRWPTEAIDGFDWAIFEDPLKLQGWYFESLYSLDLNTLYNLIFMWLGGAMDGWGSSKFKETQNGCLFCAAQS